MLRNSVGNAINTDAYGLLLYKGGTVCDDEFDTITAKAVCKEMGLVKISFDEGICSTVSFTPIFEACRW